MSGERSKREVSGDALCMVFDGDTGNVFDTFDYTPEALRAKADELEGRGSVTMALSPWGSLGGGA